MKLHYRFKSVQTWNDMEVHGMIKTADFARWVCHRHRMDRVIVESSDVYLRPDMWVVVRHVPKRYIVPPPKPVAKKIVTSAEPAYDIDAEFGPDPMSQRPEAPWVWRPCVPYVPNDPFVRDDVFALYPYLFR